MASCKFEGGKFKAAQQSKAAFRHNDISIEKRKIAKKKNKHIDLDKCKYNFSILGLSYEERCRKYDERIEYLDSHGNTNKRKDRVTMQCIEIPVPSGLPRERYHDWFLRVAALLIEKYGDINFIDGDVHYDEEHSYRNPETKELVISRVHLHFMFIPEVDGKLNAKELSLRKNMKILNKQVDDMTKAEFGCSFMTGTKKKSYKKVEELKQESENAELLYQIEQEKKALDAQQATLNAQQVALDNKDKELQDKEESIIKTQNTLAKWQENLEQRETAVKDLEYQKKAVEQEQENIKQKEESLDRAIKTVSEMPTMDYLMEQVLNNASVAFSSNPESSASSVINVTAMRYLEYLQEEQKQETEKIRKTVSVRRTIPDYTFNTQQPQDDSMEF